MKYWDNDFDRMADEELDRLFWEEKASQALANANIGNAEKLIGAQ